MGVRLLEGQQGIVSILIILHENGELMYSQILRGVGCSERAAYRALDRLMDADLVTERYEKWPRSRWFTLTEKGKKVAGKLCEIDILMKEG